jgi:electron transfer flavoprotein beta subunit
MKMVPSADEVRMDEQNMLIREGLVLITNPSDESALEAALRLKGEGAVTLLAMGNQSMGKAMYTLLANGADKAVLLNDPAMAGADTLATAKTLRAAVRYLGGFDLILCGRRAIDGETGQVPPELAMMLGLPFVTNVMRIWQDEADKLRCERLLEAGMETLCLPLPALVSLCEYSYALRPPSLASIRRSKNETLLVLDRKALRLSVEECGAKSSPTRVKRVAENQTPLRKGERAEDIRRGAEYLARLVSGAKEAKEQ